MQTMEISEAQKCLNDLIAGLRAGEEVVLVEKEKPVAKIVPVSTAEGVTRRRPQFGCAKGLIVEREDCWEDDVEVWKEYM